MKEGSGKRRTCHLLRLETVKRRDVEGSQELGFGCAVDEMAIRHSRGDAE